MRTTLDLPEDLVNQAMKVTGAKTKSQLVTGALEEVIKKEKRLRILSYKGKINFDIDLNLLRER